MSVEMKTNNIRKKKNACRRPKERRRVQVRRAFELERPSEEIARFGVKRKSIFRREEKKRD